MVVRTRMASSLIRRFLQAMASPLAETSPQSRSCATFDVAEFALHRVTAPPSRSCVCDSTQALELSRRMQLIRSVEAAGGRLFQQQLIRGMLHSYAGQEATCVGIRAAMTEADSVITAYRCHGWALEMGIPPAEVLGAMTSRASSRHQGKGGSMHLYDPQKRFYGGSGIIGAQTPIGTGLALAHKYSKTGGVSFTAFGEGAANQGQLAEAINMAVLWKLPVVYVCENNHYSYYTAQEHVTADTQNYSRYGLLPGIKVDGMDVLAVREAARWAADHARSGQGPAIIESTTYRFSGHHQSDPDNFYRSAEEVQEARRNRDPIHLFQRRILDAGLVTHHQLQEIDARIDREVAEAVETATQDPEVTVDTTAYCIVADDLGYKHVRGVTPFTPFRHESSMD